jgi:hypothetical protein
VLPSPQFFTPLAQCTAGAAVPHEWWVLAWDNRVDCHLTSDFGSSPFTKIQHPNAMWPSRPRLGSLPTTPPFHSSLSCPAKVAIPSHVLMMA